MTCGNCGSNTHRIRIYKSVENCPYCPEKHTPASMYASDGVRVRGAMGLGSKGIRTAAHDADISRRRLAPDGSVYRDYGRRTFKI